MSDEHAPETPADPEAAQPTQVMPAVGGTHAAPVDAPEPDATTVMPAVPVSDAAPAPAEPPVPIIVVPRPPAVTVPAGSRVIAIVSRGPSPARPAIPVGMPDVLGEEQGQALVRLQDVGLSVQVLADFSEQLPNGYVMGQYPMPGVSVQPGTDALLLASRGKAKLPASPVVLPRLTGMSQTMAVDALQATSLLPRIHYDYDPVAPPGTVLAQLPSEDAQANRVKKKSASKLWVIAVVVLVAIAVAAAGVWFFNRPMTIPNLMGMSQSDAERTLGNAGFRLGAVGTSQTVSAAEIGDVIGQAPDPGGSAPYGTTIDLVVSGGQALIQVPNVMGQPQTTAQTNLQLAKLLTTSNQSFSSTVPSGTVIAQSPSAGQRVPSGTTVGLIVSMGTRQVSTASVVGQSRGNAETALRLSGFGTVVASNYDTSTVAGNVISQMPSAGTSVLPGAMVGLIVSKGAAGAGSTDATTPVLVGKTLAKAKTALSKRGLKVTVVTWNGTAQPKGHVAAQLPDANVVLTKKSHVIVFVSSGR